MVRVTRGGAGSVSRSENRPHAGGRAAYRASLRASRIGRAASQYDDFLGETDVRRRFSDFFVHAQQGVASDPGNADPNVPGYLGGGTLHLHGDLIRSTLLRTDEGGQAVAVSGGPSAVLSYTAFGEPVWADPNGVVRVGFPPAGFGTRYQYAGGWGYETGLPSGDGGFRGGLAAGSPSRFVWDTTAAGPGELGRGPGSSQGLGSPEGGWVEFAAGSGRPDEFRPADDVLGLAGVHPALPPIRLLHVGWRWYDPALGRFVQRDPAGLHAGNNVYAYCDGQPLSKADSMGLAADTEFCPICGKFHCFRKHHPDVPLPPLKPAQEYRIIKVVRILVEGGAAVIVVLAGGGPVALGMGLGLICVEVYEQWTEEDENESLINKAYQ